MWDYPYVLPDLLVALIFLACYLAMPRLQNRRDRTFLRLFALLIACLTFDIVGGWICAHTPFLTAALALHWIYCAFFPLIAYAFLRFTIDILSLTPEEAPHMVGWARGAVIAVEILTLAGVLMGTTVRIDGGAVRYGRLHFLPNLCSSLRRFCCCA